MKKIVLLTLILSVSNLVISQVQPIKIVVFDSTSTIKIANCSVWVSNPATNFLVQTDSSGKAEFSIEPGKYVLSLSATGYDTMLSDIDLHKGAGVIELRYHLAKPEVVKNIIVIDDDESDKDGYKEHSISTTTASEKSTIKPLSKGTYTAPKKYKAKTGERGAAVSHGKYGSTTATSSGVTIGTAGTRGEGKRSDVVTGVGGSSATTYSYEFGDAAPTGIAHKEPISAANSGEKAGTLTAGEIHDFSKWSLWQDLNENEMKIYAARWQVKPGSRFTVQVIGTGNKPVIDCTVKLIGKEGNTVWIAKTDQTGKAELWSSLYQLKSETAEGAKIQIYGTGFSTELKTIIPFEKGINYAQVTTPCFVPDALDVAFVVDATGSMGDEINYLKAELTDVIGKVQSLHTDLSIRTGSVFYRDSFDSYLTRISDMSDNVANTVKFIKEQSADGGGDIEEAVEAGLDAALDKLTWRPNARARIIFLVLDASPHAMTAVMDRIKSQIMKAAAMGIRIVPITCSGIEKSTEYLMRSMALATNGTYLFLTDHSGVGDSHIAPSTDKYDVELLNGLLLRVFDKFVNVPLCNKPLDAKTIEKPDSVIAWNDNGLVEKTEKNPNGLETDTTKTGNESNPRKDSTKTDPNAFQLKYYPNPTNGIMYVEITGKLDEFYISDISGKSLLRYEVKENKKITVNMNSFASGIYLIKYQDGKRWLMKKFVLVY